MSYIENLEPSDFSTDEIGYSGIKIIGVGGGGCNSIQYMKIKGIHGVAYCAANTDKQALDKLDITKKIILGKELTEGLGAGIDPSIGEKAAKESEDELIEFLKDAKMLFVVAGMGGGTGTGAAPVIAQLSKQLGILTVSIVTTPFDYEGVTIQQNSESGLVKIKESSDSVIVINNNKLSDMYGSLGYKEAYNKANEVVYSAVKTMSEVVTKHYIQNIDLKDASRVIKNSGTALLATSISEGADRAEKCTKNVLESPLLNDRSISRAKKGLLIITCGKKETTQKEIATIIKLIHEETGKNLDLKIGLGDDENLNDESIQITLIVTGFPDSKEGKTEEKSYNVYSLNEAKTLNKELVQEKEVLPDEDLDEDEFDFEYIKKNI